MKSSLMNGMFVEVSWLNIMIVVMAKVKFVVGSVLNMVCIV